MSIPVAEKREDRYVRLPEHDFVVTHDKQDESARRCYTPHVFNYSDIKVTELATVPKFRIHPAFREMPR